MDYINKIVINWILYNNKVTYNYEVRESIVEYVLILTIKQIIYPFLTIFSIILLHHYPYT